MSTNTSAFALLAVAGLAIATPSVAFGQFLINTSDGTISPPVSTLGGVPIDAMRFNANDSFFELVLVGDATLSETIDVVGAHPFRIIVHGNATVAPEWNIEAVPGNAGGGTGGSAGSGGLGAQGLAGFPGLPGGAGGAGGAAGGFLFFDGYPGGTGAQGTGYFGSVPYSNASGNNGNPGTPGGAGYGNTQSPGGSGGLGANREDFFFFVFPGGGGSGGDDTTSLNSAPGFPGGPGQTGGSFANTDAGLPGGPGSGGVYITSLDEPIGGTGGGAGGGGGGGASGLPGSGGTGGGGGGGGEGGSITPGGRGGNGGQGGQGGTSGGGDIGGWGGQGGNGGGVIDLVVYGHVSIAGEFNASGSDGQAGGQPFGRTLGQNGSPGAPGAAGEDSFGSIGGRGGAGGTGTRGGDGGIGGHGGHGGGGAGGTVRVRSTAATLSNPNINVGGGASPAQPGQNGGFKLLTSSPLVGDPHAVSNASVVYTNDNAGPAYDTNPYVQNQPTTPLITTTIGGPDHYGIIGSFDLNAYIPDGSDGLWLVRINGMVEGTSDLLRPLSGMDYLLLINTDADPIANPAISIGNANTAPLTPVPLATRGTADAIAGMAGTPLAQLFSDQTWGTVIPSSLPADVIVEFNGERVELMIQAGETIDLTTHLNPCNIADFNDDGQLNFFDVSEFLVAYQSQEARADLNNDGQFNFFDVSTFLQAYSIGCP
ncbi:MAG: hypothetical protein KDA29_13315 [Phycisphaerales bacterium]|nr:hypothetical protein [Phycisphaerales bacterium]